jgi:diguanylate cyclase (GGDEF)-like protein
MIRKIPIIFISVLDDVTDKVKGIQMGGADYITKPFQLEEVVVRVQNQLTIQRLQMQLQEINQKLLKQNSLLQLEIEKRRKAEIALQEANEKLQELAWLDSLTEVANRRYLDDYLQREWQRSAREKTPLAFILCDIDYFKTYNDTYGHIAGDATLKRVAKAIKTATRRPADLVARYGGEEFAVVLPNTNFFGTVQVAENIQLQLQELKIVHAMSIVNEYLTLSIGMTVCIPNHQYSLSNLIATTDQALYHAKQQGRDHYCAYISFSRSCFSI